MLVNTQYHCRGNPKNTHTKEKERNISLRKFLDKGFLFCVTEIFNTSHSLEQVLYGCNPTYVKRILYIIVKYNTTFSITLRKWQTFTLRIIKQNVDVVIGSLSIVVVACNANGEILKVWIKGIFSCENVEVLQSLQLIGLCKYVSSC